METYHRKRSKRSAINDSNEMMSLKRQQTISVLDGAQRQLLIDTDYEEEIELGSVYEIYHKNLPLRTPFQLKCTRVVMVSEKTDLNVGIRYPSVGSLRNYFSSGIKEMYPALDEKFVMGIKLARKVLLRQVPSKEFAEKKHLESFWLVKKNNNQLVDSRVSLKNEDIGVARELKNNMIRWGVRRQVMFIGKHKENNNNNTHSDSSFVQEVKVEQQIKNDECQEDEELEVDDDETEEETQSIRKLRKRNNLLQVNRKPMKKCKKLSVRDPTDRWSKERYMAAELSLLEAMKEKKAMIGNPITRPALRVEARKRIGDTGLLDHLLKHVANKVAPCGTLRFRRSHNADGAMEYWLESADLLKIRKDAGIKDPFWVPPPGWKPGGSHVQDPVVAKEINQLKQEILDIKKKHEEELGKLTRVIHELTSKKDLNEATTEVSEEAVDSSQKQVLEILSFMLGLKSNVKRETCNNVISKFIKTLQARMQREAEKDKNKNEDVAGDGGKIAIAVAGEGKAAKIERLKSGFRLCRPQGTFMWPNTNTSSCSQVSDLMLVVPTPPSVNSSTPPKHKLTLALPPPLKPVPERPRPNLTLNL